MSNRTKIILVTSVAGLVTAALGVRAFLRHISAPRIVARATSSGGVEMCIVQQCNWSAEPFTTSFVYRKPGADWGWFYYSHEDWYWGASRVSVDTNASSAVFYRGSSPAVTFAWATETYTLHRWNRTLTGAQLRLPKGWSPGQSVHSK